MDFIKKAAGSFANSNDQPTNNAVDQTGQTQQAGQVAEGQQSVQKDDYVDKAFAAAAGKSGYNIDRNTQEKITDGARDAYEKYSGKKVSDKISN